MNEAKDSETVAGLSVIIAGGRDYELTPRSLATVSKLLARRCLVWNLELGGDGIWQA